MYDVMWNMLQMAPIKKYLKTSILLCAFMLLYFPTKGLLCPFFIVENPKY